MLNKKPFFSIVTISFNQARFLTKCLQSIKDQDFTDYELIVVDPGSTDGSLDIIKGSSDVVDILINKPDDGPPDGLNRGFRRASGQYFFYLNSDDELHADALINAYNYITRYPGIDVFLLDGSIVDELSRHKKFICSTYQSPLLFRSGVSKAVQQGTFIKASSFKAVGGFNKTNNVCWDTELIADLILYGSKFKSGRVLVGKFRHYSGTITCSPEFDIKRRAEKRRLNRKFRNYGFFEIFVSYILKPYKHILKAYWIFIGRVIW
jgi:glycosyltransferase involved in cell wall biosynthesis